MNSRALSWALLAVALLCAGWSVSRAWNMSVGVTGHGFRQSQTALGARTIAEGGPVLAYETPVLGAPWSIPFEFPLYQAVVGETVRIAGTPLHETARFWSMFAFGLALLPLYRIGRRFGMSADAARVFCALVAVSPLYVAWNRTILIESTALSLAITFLDQATEATRRLGDPARHLVRPLVCGVLFGVLAALVKPTTLLPFLVAWIIDGAFRLRSPGEDARRLVRRAIVPTVLLGVVPIVAAAVWTSYADAAKLRNPLAAGFIDSSSLIEWNFGSLHQRFGPQLWEMVLGYDLVQALGNKWVAIALLPMVLAAGGMMARLAALSLVLFASGPLVFANLYAVHTYYGYAIGVFAIAALAFALSGIDEMRPGLGKVLSVALLVLFVGKSLALPAGDDRPFATLGQKIRESTSEGDVLLAYGLDWDPTLPYEAHRRAIMDRWNIRLGTEGSATTSDRRIEKALQELSKRDLQIGAVVFCGASRNPEFVRDQTRALGLSGPIDSRTPGCDLFLRSPSKG